MREVTTDVLNGIKDGSIKKKGFFFFGAPGVGKTYEAEEIAKVHRANPDFVYDWQRERSVITLDCAKDLKKLDEMVFTNVNTGDKYSMYQRLVDDRPGGNNQSLLVIDDLAPEFIVNKFERRNLYVIIDHYWKNNLPLVITSNLSIDELAAHETLGERFVSRINGACNIIRIDGDDLRGSDIYGNLSSVW